MAKRASVMAIALCSAILAYNLFVYSREDGAQIQVTQPEEQVSISETKQVAAALRSINAKIDRLAPNVDSLERMLQKAQSNASPAEGLSKPQLVPSKGWVRSEKQTIVMPVAPSDLDRFRNLMKSFRKFFDFSSVTEFIVIAPKRVEIEVPPPYSVVDIGSECEADSPLQTELQELVGDVTQLRILEDAEVLPGLATRRLMGWMQQQLLKLAVAKFVKTRFYLVLDADLLCFKPTSFSDLVTGNRALTNMYNSPHAVTRIDWWQASEKVLDMKLPTEHYFGVTPSLLATEIVMAMQNHLTQLHGEAWDTYLLRNANSVSFTEYCLYGVYAACSGMFKDYHIPTYSGVYHHEKSVFWKEQFDALDLKDMVQNGHLMPGHFVVIQSNTKIPATQVQEKMGSLFD